MTHTNKKHSSWSLQNVTSVISTTMVLVLLGLVILFVLTAQELGESVRENLTVTVVLQDDVPSPEAAKLQSRLRGKRYVSDIEYISAERALKEQIENMGFDPTDFLGSNPFSISMELKVR
ncbi:MAG: cell division protein FtsX, partial [Bacteroidaceae bacterium]|nr:cell division protein FtsX [Bacteroidaceae bacterium]